jgi:hypothetical protein
MAIQTPPSAPADPSPVPTRADSGTFDTRADSFLGWLPAFRTWLIAALSNVVNNATETLHLSTSAGASATTATSAAAAAASSAQVSAAAAGAAPWISGTYAAHACAIGIARPLVYRRKAPGGASPTDPALDPANWALASTVGLQMVPATNATTDASPGGWYPLLNASASTLRLPTSPTIGDPPIGVAPSNGRTDNLVDAQGLPIHGSTATRTLNVRGEAFTFTWVGGTFGWFVNRFIVPGSPASDAIQPAQAQALTQQLHVATGGIKGYVGPVGPDNFGINWIRRPISFDGVSGTAAALDNDNGPISKYGGTESAGWVRVFFGFSANGTASGLFTAGTTTIVANRLADLRKVLKFWHHLGKKVLLVLDAPITNSSSDTALYRDRLQVMLRQLDPGTPSGTALPQADWAYIDAVEPVNEPYNGMYGAGGTFVGNQAGGNAMLAEKMRVTYTIFKAFSPRTLVCTPTWQGGETAVVEPMLAASAAGVAVRGDGGGAGTRGEMFFDVISYHPYDNVATVADAQQNFSQARTARTIRQYSTFIQTAIANRRADTAGGGAAWWAGKPDPEYWATELNVCPAGGNITSNTAFRMQVFELEERRRLIQAVVLGCFASGYSKVFPYAPDHVGDAGPWTPAAQTTAANGIDVRCTSSPAPVFDGDIVLSFANGFSDPITGVAANANSAGSAFDIIGVAPSYTLNYQTVARFLLGGWAAAWPAIQAEVTGQVEAGFIATGNSPDSHLPQVRVNRGFIRRVVAGKLTDLGV